MFLFLRKFKAKKEDKACA